MHYEKTYTRLLSSLPPELCKNAVQYRQLKKLIKRIASELSSLGLTPEVLHGLIQGNGTTLVHNTGDSTQLGLESLSIPKVVYELNDGNSTRIEPQLRIWISSIPSATLSKDDSIQGSMDSLEGDVLNENGGNAAGTLYNIRLSRTLQQPTNNTIQRRSSEQDLSNLLAPIRQTIGVGQATIQQVVIPLVQEKEFYNMLTTALELASQHLKAMQSDFLFSLRNLSDIISNSVHPTSAASTFRPYSSLTADAGSVRVKTWKLKSDLYSWREIFQLYLEAEIFESIGEQTRGERSVEESEKRLQLFVEWLSQHPRARKNFKMKQSANALATFLSLNMFILNVKKFSLGNVEATRKILKKHAKRTALPLPLSPPSTMTVSGVSPPHILNSYTGYTTIFSLPRTLVQAIGETLIPIIPHIDDYSCLICTSIAFKPIRLTCGHLFCVRCLVKMQKRNKNLCPLCRAPCVLAANRDNVDWGLLNFMQDWFPLEAKAKLSSNEKEAAAEELEGLGIMDPNASCLLM